RACIIPGVNYQHLILLEGGWVDLFVTPPIVSQRAIRISQNVIISNRGVRNGSLWNSNRCFPELRVQVSKRNGLRTIAVAEQLVVTNEQQRLSKVSVKTKLKGQAHV